MTNDEYYLVQGGEKTGPYSFKQLLGMDINIHTELIAPKSDEAQYASELPEFDEYFKNKGIYFPTVDNLAPYSARIFAFIVDYFLVSMVVGVVVLKMGWVVLPAHPSLTLPYPGSVILVSTFSVTFLLYNVLFELSKFKSQYRQDIVQDNCGGYRWPEFKSSKFNIAEHGGIDIANDIRATLFHCLFWRT